jgi:hypothetical protein
MVHDVRRSGRIKLGRSEMHEDKKEDGTSSTWTDHQYGIE